LDREIITTKDGSHSLLIKNRGLTYHSIYGAVQESEHVYIAAGLRFFCSYNLAIRDISIFEMGFGTGLNALLSLKAAPVLNRKICYTAIDYFPLEAHEAAMLNYGERENMRPVFMLLHHAIWGEPVKIDTYFTLTKIKALFETYIPEGNFHVIYYDAFSPLAQPELWTEEIFSGLYRMLFKGGIVVTYCSKGAVRRAMTAAGFLVEKIPGPPGKREILRGLKL